MIAALVAVGLVLVSNAAKQGLTTAEIAEFKPINESKTEQNTGVQGLVNVTDPGAGLTYYTAYTNGVPSHSNLKWPREEEVRPIYLNITHVAFNIPKIPKLREKPLMCVPFGIVGVATGGVMIYNAYTPRKDCPIANLVEAFDMCMGHPDPGGGYHYHGHSSCNRMEVCGQKSKIFGVALDGIPIFGPFDENGKQLIQTDLDICGGRIGKDGRYKYHITGDPPFLLNCFRGEIHKDILKTKNPMKDTFTCTCPLTDEGYPECHEDIWCEDEKGKYTPEEIKAAEKSWRENRRNTPRKPKICKWDVAEGDFAECIDVLNKSSGYTPGFKQTRRYSTTKLIGCCPQGMDCGETCRDNAQCYTEERPGMFLVTEVGLVSGGTAERIGVIVYCMIFGLTSLYFLECI